jgi:hypothetical protein
MTDPKALDKLRSDLFQDTAAFAQKLRDAEDPEPLREQALQRIIDLFRYAGPDGRRRFLDAMQLPGAYQERRRVYDICRRAGRPDAECQSEAEAVPLFRDLLEAYPKSHVLNDWWAAPVSQLIGSYDPQNPPGDDFIGWEGQLRRTHGKAGAELLLGVGAAFEAAGETLSDAYDSAREGANDALNAPAPPRPFPWLKVGLGLSGATLVGALAYRITRK